MLPLDSAQWSQFNHAYGAARNIPGLILQLEVRPPGDDPKAEPYFSLWSALCHQGDIYSASYAAVPHLIRIIREDPLATHWTVLLLAISIEIARMHARGPEIPKNLRADYFDAIKSILEIAKAARETEEKEYQVTLEAAVAVAEGSVFRAEKILGQEEI